MGFKKYATLVAVTANPLNYTCVFVEHVNRKYTEIKNILSSFHSRTSDITVIQRKTKL